MLEQSNVLMLLAMSVFRQRDECLESPIRKLRLKISVATLCPQHHSVIRWLWGAIRSSTHRVDLGSELMTDGHTQHTLTPIQTNWPEPIHRMTEIIELILMIFRWAFG